MTINITNGKRKFHCSTCGSLNTRVVQTTKVEGYIDMEDVPSVQMDYECMSCSDPLSMSVSLDPSIADNYEQHW